MHCSVRVTDGLTSVQAVSTNKAADLDGKFSGALRDTLFGKFGEDLSTRNMFRSKDMGMKQYVDLAKCYKTRPMSSVCFALDAL